MSSHSLAQIASLGQQQIGDFLPTFEILQTRARESVQFTKDSDLSGDVVTKGAAQLRQFAQNQSLQGSFDLVAEIRPGVAQPLIPLFEHLADELARSLKIVVEVQKKIGQARVAGL